MLERAMTMIAGWLRNRGMPGMKLTLVARDPDRPGRWIIKSDDDLAAVAALLQQPPEQRAAALDRRAEKP